MSKYYSLYSNVPFQLRKSNERMQSSLQGAQVDLQNALDAKFAKEGEVTILRKGIEKVNNTKYLSMSTKRPMHQTSQEHAAHIEKLKAAKEEGDTKQQVLKKQFKAEIEHLKTEFTFKVSIIKTYFMHSAHRLRSNRNWKVVTEGLQALSIPRGQQWDHHRHQFQFLRKYVLGNRATPLLVLRY